MTRGPCVLAAAFSLLLASSSANMAAAQHNGGVLKIGHFDSPASMSLLEESTVAVNRPMSGVFNNLVMFDQHVPQNSLRSIVPDLATGWAWNEEGTELTFSLRHNVKWHDGTPFTAADVKCTVDLLMGNSKEKLRINPRKSWFANVTEVTTNGDYEATFHLKRPQPSFLALLATGWSPVYPCHVSPRDMRTHPIGTGPFKFVEFKPNQSITVTRNPDYWKEGRPYLDAIQYTIIKDVSTRLLSFISGKDDAYFGVTIPQLKDVKSQAPEAICEEFTSNVPRNLLVNRDAPPFDNPDLRRAMSLSPDRKAFVDILTEGQGDIGAVDTTQWYPKLMRKDYTLGLNVTETAVDDPDPAFYENYVCGAMRNYTGYCNPEIDKMVDQQSAMSDVAKRKQMVWAIEKKLAEDDVRPILFYTRVANCHYPKVKGLVTQVNSIYNGQRFEDLWLDN